MTYKAMNILSFDIEEWFHILDNDTTKSETEWSCYERRLDDNIERIFQLLDESGHKATFFCLGWVVREYPNVIRRIHGYGHEVATHSDSHQLAYEQSRYEFSEDLKRSIGSIEDITGNKVRAYRAPGFSLKEENKWGLEVLAENGIEIDCSIFPVKRAHGGFATFGHARPAWVEMNGIRLKEFPINLYSIAGHSIIFSGGGYFRLLPYSVIAHMMRSSDYVMTYFHPRDFDDKQPVIKQLSILRKFKSYYGLSTAFRKLKSLVKNFHFIDLDTADKQIDWANAPIIQL
ncbi:polysaccharide deacetylase family protein [Prosthecochloris sp. SCSIO W1103]|uniref:polysaccharide deacetylase family protein n=1 Tax=Prosthecochloris sp. SCSIO W1103 TaxID=2992244 RepID=UPI00223C97BC|nr:polysaccharide deacetylase family protein [Prosthecochloris sp. SCSIO W1103]UZJ38154.1 polysaccharide deacetylase family protein [Prosthecochloris sp. SCSIO W1103]